MLDVAIADSFCFTEQCYRNAAMSWTLKLSQKDQEEEEQPSNLESLGMIWKQSFVCFSLGANSSRCSWIMFIWKRSMKIKAARGDSKEHMMETNWVTTNVADIVGGNWDTRVRAIVRCTSSGLCSSVSWKLDPR